MTRLSIILSLLPLSLSIFSDQFGKEDWHLENIGKIDQAIFSEQNAVKASSSAILLSTENNLLAKLDLSSSNIIWREVSHGAKILAILDINTSAFLALTENSFLTVAKKSGQLLASSKHATYSNAKIITSKSTAQIILPEKAVYLTNFYQNSKLTNDHKSLEITTFEHQGSIAVSEKYCVYKSNDHYSLSSDSESSLQIPCDNVVIFTNKIYYSCDGGSYFIDADEQVAREIKSEKVIENLVLKSGAIYGQIGSNLVKIEDQDVVIREIPGKIQNLVFDEISNQIFAFVRPNRSVTPKLDVKVFDAETLSERFDHAFIDFSYEGFSDLNFIKIDSFVSNQKKHKRILAQVKDTLELKFNNRWSRQEGLANSRNNLLVDIPEEVESRSENNWRFIRDFVAVKNYIGNVMNLGLAHLLEAQENSFLYDLLHLKEEKKLKRDIYTRFFENA